MKLKWNCCVCNRPVADGKGYLSVSAEQIAAYQAAQAEADAAGPALTLREVAETFDGVGPARWQFHHSACDPEPDNSDYWIAVERIRTAAEVLDWTAHLLEKRWFGATDWGVLTAKAAAQLRRAS